MMTSPSRGSGGCSERGRSGASKAGASPSAEGSSPFERPRLTRSAAGAGAGEGSGGRRAGTTRPIARVVSARPEPVARSMPATEAPVSSSTAATKRKTARMCAPIVETAVAVT